MLKIIALSLLWLGGIKGNELFQFEGGIPVEDPCLFVGLGSGCDTGLTLRDCGFRKAAFPFDWIVNGDHQKLLLLLEEDFKFFTDPARFEKLSSQGIEDHPNSLRNRYYDITFYHEGSVLYDWSDEEKYREQLQRLQVKYERRIQRFRQLRDYPGRVFFIRNFTTSQPDRLSQHTQMARELREALECYFPSLDFVLVIVTYQDLHAPPIEGVEGVMEFQMHRPSWREEYANMYQALLLSVDGAPL
jgi:hypothetical protein